MIVDDTPIEFNFCIIISDIATGISDCPPNANAPAPTIPMKIATNGPCFLNIPLNFPPKLLGPLRLFFPEPVKIFPGFSSPSFTPLTEFSFFPISPLAAFSALFKSFAAPSCLPKKSGRILSLPEFIPRYGSFSERLLSMPLIISLMLTKTKKASPISRARLFQPPVKRSTCYFINFLRLAT